MCTSKYNDTKAKKKSNSKYKCSLGGVPTLIKAIKIIFVIFVYFV